MHLPLCQETTVPAMLLPVTSPWPQVWIPHPPSRFTLSFPGHTPHSGTPYTFLHKSATYLLHMTYIPQAPTLRSQVLRESSGLCLYWGCGSCVNLARLTHSAFPWAHLLPSNVQPLLLPICAGYTDYWSWNNSEKENKIHGLETHRPECLSMEILGVGARARRNGAAGASGSTQSIETAVGAAGLLLGFWEQSHS